MNLRRALGLIDVLDVSTDAGQEAERAANRLQQAAREWVIEYRQRHISLGARLAERRGPLEADRAVRRGGIVPRRPEQSVSSTNHRVLAGGIRGAAAG